MVATPAALTSAREPVVLPIIVVLAISAVVGALTRVGEVTLPASVQSAANSTAPWVLVTFTAVALARLSGPAALVTGGASFVAMDVAFFVTFGLTGGYYPRSYLLFWLVVGVIVGPFVALAATWLRRDGWRGIIAAAAVPSVFLGEAAFVLIRLPAVGPVYPGLLVMGGIALLVTMLRIGRRQPRAVAAVVGATLVGSAVFALGYNLVPLIIGKVVP